MKIPDSFDKTERYLLLLDSYVISLLIASVVVFYQIRSLYSMTHDEALEVSFYIGFIVATVVLFAIVFLVTKFKKKDQEH